MSVFVFMFYFSTYFARDISKTAEPIFIKSSKKIANGLQLSFLISELFWGVSFKKVTCASDPGSQNATWRQNGFTYRKKKVV